MYKIKKSNRYLYRAVATMIFQDNLQPKFDKTPGLLFEPGAKPCLEEL